MKKENIKTLEQLKNELKEQIENILSYIIIGNRIKVRYIDEVLQRECDAVKEFTKLFLNGTFEHCDEIEFYDCYEKIFTEFMSKNDYELEEYDEDEEEEYYFKKNQIENQSKNNLQKMVLMSMVLQYRR